MKADRKEQIVEELLLDNYEKYYRLAFSYVHNEADAKDIVQEGAYKAIYKSDTLKNKEFAATWIYRIMLNEIFRSCQKKQREISMEVSEESGKEDTYENLDLKRALNRLEPGEKAIVELRYFEDMKLEDIAGILDLNLSTVKSRLYRAMGKLRVTLAD